MRFSDYASAVDRLPWPSTDADSVLKEAVARLTTPASRADYSREAYLADLGLVLWYVAVAARNEGVALSSVADKSLACLSAISRDGHVFSASPVVPPDQEVTQPDARPLGSNDPGE